ncbi:MAG: ergothioneine biosynthesis protein EgtB [Gammaproteobacteria bacterium]
MINQTAPAPGREALVQAYRQVRAFSETICAPLATDDYQIQSIVETSPPKWHIAHITWFFETFVLPRFRPDYRPFHPQFAYLFNSYYETVGSMHPRPKRGLLSRPTVEQVYAYRAHVDAAMEDLMGSVPDNQWDELVFRVTLGLNHEQQHQELLFMDIKHNLSVNPMKPAYREDLVVPGGQTRPMAWIERPGGIREIGASGEGFAFDNETPRHRVLTRDHRLADRLVTNGEFLEFMEDGGYDDPALWLADGWYLIRREGWRNPLYWERTDDGWKQFTLGGQRPLNPHEPVCHLSFYEADAYARWVGKRLPLEDELETVLADKPVQGNFAGMDLLHPAPAGEGGQWFGDLWAWTATPYGPYPGFKPLEGSMGEYNGKFMSNQMVLKGGCCATPEGHARASYRNFFYPHDRWAFTGLRLAEDA